MFPSILIVDDEPSIIQSLAGLLSDEGFEVMSAFNGYEALKIIDAESPDLVLLDLMLPKLGGYELCRKVRSEGIAIPIIMLTARGEEADRVLGLDLGVGDLLLGNRAAHLFRKIAHKVREGLWHGQNFCHLVDKFICCQIFTEALLPVFGVDFLAQHRLENEAQ